MKFFYVCRYKTDDILSCLVQFKIPRRGGAENTSGIAAGNDEFDFRQSSRILLLRPHENPPVNGYGLITELSRAEVVINGQG